MFKSSLAKAGLVAAPCVVRVSPGVRSLSSSSLVCAAVAPPVKKKASLGFKRPAKEKVKKGGMTHLKFGEAVRKLKYENFAKDLDPLNLSQLSAEGLLESRSTITTYEPQAQKKLSGLGSFKKLQGHELFQRPVSLVSANTIELYKGFLNKFNGSTKDNRVCLLGEKGCGKSTLISQLQALALSKHKDDVVLLHIDHPERIVEGSSDYIMNTEMKQYQQPMFTKRWVRKLRLTNEAVFKKMPLTEDVTVHAKKSSQRLKQGEHTVYDYVTLNHEFGVVGPTFAFRFLIKQLQAHSKEFPVFVSIDNFNALIADAYTKYFHPDMRPIHVTEFEMGNFIKQLVSGELSFAKGGVLLAESRDVGECKTLKVGLGLQEPNPYAKIHECDLEFAESMTQNGGVASFAVQNFTKEDARSFLSFLQQAGVLRLRDYPTKATYKSLEDRLPQEKVHEVGQYISCEDPAEQFEKTLQTSFFTSSGNPGVLLKLSSSSF